MPPKSANLDGVTRPVAAPPVAESDEDVKKEPKDEPIKDKSSIETELKQHPLPALKSEIKASKVNSGPVITILITLILMVLLIGLAYLAYNKSK